MKTQDAIYYSGLMAGIIIGTLVLRELGVSGIWQLIGGLVLGVGIGYIAEQTYNSGRSE